MADFSITLTVEDPKIAGLVAAINWHDPPVDGNGDPLPDRTAAECRTWFKARAENALKDIYKRYQEHLRDQTVIDPDISVT